MRLLLSLLYRMWNFSFKQRRHFLVIGLKLGALSIKSHLRVKSIFLSFSSQTWALRLVLCLSFSFRISLLCLYHLSLNLLLVSPVYVSVLPTTSYDIWRRRQFSTNQRPRNYLTHTDTESTYCQALLYEQRLQKN